MERTSQEFDEKEFWYKDQCFFATGRVFFETDRNYGADADNNRGTTRTTVDEVELDYVIDENDVEVTIEEGMKDAIAEAFK